MSGFTARLFAHLYPDETAGIILVDSVCVDEPARMIALLPPESAIEKNAVRGIRNWNKRLLDNPMANVEFWDFPTSADHVREIKTHGDLPMVVLTRDVINKEMQKILIDSAFGPGLPVDLHEKMEEDWLLQQEELAQFSTNSKHIIVEGTSHILPVEKPEAVVDAIQWVLEQIRE
jgi:pimeloyl-ACP methyl ester carboxylesterase